MIWNRDEEGAWVIPTMGRNNCGGRCIIKAHVKDGRILRLTTDTEAEAGDTPPLRACARGMNYHTTFLGKDRLLYPLKRTGKRGEGKFARISWKEAMELLMREWVRIRDAYGPASRYVNYGTGVSALLRGGSLAKRLLALDGGFLDCYNSYSTACTQPVTPLLYGTAMSGSSYDTWLDSKLILLWGHNPAETKFDSGTMYYLRKAKEKGIPIIGIDPRENDTIRSLGARWIPLRPSTDAALMDAMAWVIWREGMYDRDFTDRFCLGFDAAHMPEGADPEKNYFAWLSGSWDGVEKTPEWAGRITGVPPQEIRWLARAYASAKPAALIQGYGPQRHGNGEQATRGGIMLACLTGNVGVSGGWAAGAGYVDGHRNPWMPSVPNPCPYEIPSFLWTEAVLRGRELTPSDGVRGGERLPSEIKMIFSLASNMLINQHSDINRTRRILEDTDRCEFIVCSDLFLTSSARWADLILPATSMFESENIAMPWVAGDFLGFHNKVIEPLGECRFEYDWLKEAAACLGLYEAFTEGHETVGDWLRDRYEALRQIETELPDYETFRREGVYRYRKGNRVVAFEEQVRDPQNHPFPTDSGKIEIFSSRIDRGEYREPVLPIPGYLPAPEGPEDPLRERYPLQLTGWHTKRRCHSIHDNNARLQPLDPQRLWLHPQDAKERGLLEGDMALVWNDRGKLRIPVKITERVMPGVAALSQGAWYRPDEEGVDTGGCINVLTSQRPTALSKGNPQHTNLVEVRKDDGGSGDPQTGRKKEDEVILDGAERT